MFGTNYDNSQPQGGPVTHPTNNDHNINDDIPAAPPEPQQHSGQADSVFPSTGSDDPFGTTPIIDDPSAAADPQATQSHTQQQTTVSDSQKVNTPSSHSNDLIGIKQQALHELSPLVKHLDQSAEEKFKTTMMMIQASDDQSLVPEAFECAKQIADDKARAQALLDIINEINYFTQNHDE